MTTYLSLFHFERGVLGVQSRSLFFSSFSFLLLGNDTLVAAKDGMAMSIWDI
jgi:hypothetical protein